MVVKILKTADPMSKLYALIALAVSSINLQICKL